MEEPIEGIQLLDAIKKPIKYGCSSRALDHFGNCMKKLLRVYVI